MQPSVNIGDDDLLVLDEAAGFFAKPEWTPDFLAKEMAEGRLTCYDMGGKIFTTYAHLCDMDRESRAVLHGTVYFVGFGPYVKIGFTTGPLKYRLQKISTGSPEDLEIYARMPGTIAEEKALHQRFSRYRTRGEWFRHIGELADYIEMVARK